MQGDFSRSTFDPRKHFSAVLSQQGRVELDADRNEETAILLRYVRQLAADVIGPAGYPTDAAGFEISVDGDDLSISPGRLYVDGILLENDEADATYFTQPDGYLDKEREPLPETGRFVVYLRVWERLVTALQDPLIREVALGDLGPDTSARAQVVWQVAHFPLPNGADPVPAWQQWLNDLHTPRGKLRARAGSPDDTNDEPCVLPPGSRFRGESNQLYRVEIHRTGKLGTATFKWSRENASVVFPIVSLSGDQVEVSSLGRDGKLGLETGDIVEIVDNALAARVADDVPPDSVPRLRRVLAVDPAHRLVTLDPARRADQTGVGTDPRLAPLLRRWDHQPPAPSRGSHGKKGAHPAPENTIPVTDEWTQLEDGVFVQFANSDSHFRRGDFWLIPARTVTGDIIWPTDRHGPVLKEPDGVDYHYTPLAVITAGGTPTDLRLPITRVTTQTAKRSSSRRASS